MQTIIIDIYYATHAENVVATH